MHQATSNPSHIFTKQHLIKHRNFNLQWNRNRARFLWSCSLPYT